MKLIPRCSWKPPPITRSIIVPRTANRIPQVSVVSNVHTSNLRLIVPINPMIPRRFAGEFSFSPMLGTEKNDEQATFLKEFVEHLQSDKMEEANSMFDAMVKHGEHNQLLTTQLCGAYLTKLSKHKMFARAFKLYDLAVETKVNFGTLYLSFFEMALKAKDMDRAYDFLEEYFDSNRKARMDESIILVFAREFSRNKNWKDIKDLFDYIASCEKDQKRLMILHKFYMNILLKEFGVKRGDLAGMEKVLELFESLDVDRTPLTYNTLMSAYALQKNPQKFLLQMALMTKAGFKPSLATYNLMVLMFACVGDTRKMEEYLTEMKKNGLVSAVTYFNVIFGFLNSSEFEKALDYLEEFREVPGYKPSKQLYFVMSRLLKKNNKKDLLERMMLILKQDKTQQSLMSEEGMDLDEEVIKQLMASMNPDKFL